MEEGDAEGPADLIPDKYSREGLSFEVPAGGTDSADFELTTGE